MQTNAGLDSKYVGMHAITENGEKTQSKYLIEYLLHCSVISLHKCYNCHLQKDQSKVLWKEKIRLTCRGLIHQSLHSHVIFTQLKSMVLVIEHE